MDVEMLADKVMIDEERVVVMHAPHIRGTYGIHHAVESP